MITELHCVGSGYYINVSPDTAKVHHYRANPRGDLGFLYIKGKCNTVDHAARRYGQDYWKE